MADIFLLLLIFLMVYYVFGDELFPRWLMKKNVKASCILS